MAFNALNSPAPMNMPDFEDASPPHFQPDGTPSNQPVGIFAALQNAKEIHEGRWNDRPYEVVKKGKTRAYRIDKPPAQWPTRLARPPSIHVRYDHVTVDGEPAPGLVAITTLWTFNNYDALTRAGSGVYFYIPKLQTPREALIIEKLLSRLEGLIGVPAGTLKIKMLYEEGNAGRQLPAIALGPAAPAARDERRPVGLPGEPHRDVEGRSQGRLPGPADDRDGHPDHDRLPALQRAAHAHGRLEETASSANSAPIGGMAAVMIYQANDPYGRSKYNPVALRAIAIDKLRERVLGLMFVPEAPLPAGAQPTLEDILAGRVKGRLYDAYRQSWVASPETEYVAAGNAPLRADLKDLQALLDAPRETVDVKGKPVPTVRSGLSDAERQLFQSRGLLNAQGKVTPAVLTKDQLDAPEKLLTRELWDAIYGVPKGEVTIEHVQHSFYMAANYGFQILNGNFAAAIDDYELKQRFMNDLATYRINVSWLWALAHHEAAITKDGHLQRQVLTEDGVVIGANAEPIKAGTRFTRELFDKVWDYHYEWTNAFFAEQDRRGDPPRFDRSKADVIMELLKRQLLSPRYIQHSARVLFVVGQASPSERAQILDAIFDLPREEIVKRVQAGSMGKSALSAHDYVLDVFEGVDDLGAGRARRASFTPPRTRATASR